MSHPTLSVIMITKNAAQHLDQSLHSVAFANEIIMVDSGSTDATLEIAKRHAVKLYQTTVWPGFGAQKNYALSLATGDWVLSLDADEIVSPELATAIRNAITHPMYDAYQFERVTFYCGKMIRHSGWNHDWLLRLLKRQMGQFTDRQIHEKLTLIPTATLGILQGKLLHYSYNNFSEVLQKMDFYSTYSAQRMQQQGKRSSVTRAILAYWAGFLHAYLIRAGWLDGKMGLLLAINHGQNKYYRMLKLMMMQDKC